MSEKPENPQAFPSGRMEGYEPAQHPQHSGMTLRDYFAGIALPSVISAASFGVHTIKIGEDESIEDGLAKDAYRVADAMLRARQP